MILLEERTANNKAAQTNAKRKRLMDAYAAEQYKKAKNAVQEKATLLYTDSVKRSLDVICNNIPQLVQIAATVPQQAQPAPQPQPQQHPIHNNQNNVVPL